MKVLNLPGEMAMLVAMKKVTKLPQFVNWSHRGPIAIRARFGHVVHNKTYPWGHTFVQGNESVMLVMGKHEGGLYDAMEGGTWFTIPRGAILAVSHVLDCVPIVEKGATPRERVAHIGIGRHTDRLGLWVPTEEHYGGGAISGSFDSWGHRDIDDQRAYGDFRPGDHALCLGFTKLLPEPITTPVLRDWDPPKGLRL